MQIILLVGAVITFEDILCSIKKCYTSMFSDKSLSYIWRNGITLHNLQMGVIIQEFILGSPSGVVFSVDTIDMDDTILHINAVNGLCSGYVSGKLPSCFYKINKTTRNILDSQIPSDSFQLSDFYISNLFKTALQIEYIFGCSQDIEWTIRDNELYILQARQITTFRKKEFIINWKDPQDAQNYWCLGPNIPFPPFVQSISPVEEIALDYGVLKAGYSHRRTARCIQNGYIYFRNLEMDNWQEVQDSFMLRVHEMFNEGKNIFQDVLLPQLLTVKVKLDNFSERRMTRQEAVDYLDTAKDYFTKAWSSHWPAVHGRKYRKVFEEYCKEVLGDIELVDFYDLIYNTSMASLERELLMKMAETVTSDKELVHLFSTKQYDEIVYQRLKKIKMGIKLLEQIDSYLKIYGMCGTGGEDFLRSVLRERPEVIIKKLRPLLKLNTNTFLMSLKKTKENKQKIIERIISTIGKDKAPDFFRKLEMAEKAFLTGDDHNYYIDSSAWGYLKLAVLEAARILLENDEIDDVSDILYLNFDEVKDALLHKLSISAFIQERKNVFLEQKKLLPPRFIGKKPNEMETHLENAIDEIIKDDESLVLKGISGLKKNVIGVIHLDIPSNLEEDSILVIWNGHCGDIMHIINSVKGLIFVDGSPFDHLGILAREMNIPTLYYVKDAFKLLKNGDKVELDGTKGLVVRIDVL